jgi:glyoxylase-like metal-dependent hydrolase (beta-lactamase superfamily II)
MRKSPQISPQTLKLKIGPYEVFALRCGQFGLDGGAMFGTVPKVLWQKKIPADEQNRIPMQTRVLLLKSEQYLVLVDTGNGGDFEAKYGPKLGSKFASIYNINLQTHLLQALAERGFKPEDVTHVILTHLHFDHAGGATRQDPQSGRIVPSFPKARYFVQQRNLETALNPNRREKASYLAANIQPLLDSQQLELLTGPTEEVLPHVAVTLSEGHTAGMQVVWVQDGNSCLLYGADLIPTHAHVRLPWVMGYDLQPLTLIEEKEQVLKRLLSFSSSYLFFEHDPYMDAAQLIWKEEEKDFDIQTAYLL